MQESRFDIRGGLIMDQTQFKAMLQAIGGIKETFIALKALDNKYFLFQYERDLKMLEEELEEELRENS